MSLAADKKRWDDLHAALAKAEAATREYELSLVRTYGANFNRSWLTRPQQKKLEAFQERADKIGEKIFELVTKISPRDWSYGVPTWWVRRELTWEDAIRPKGEPLSVVVPGSYGSRDGTVTERESSMARRTPRNNTPESAGSQYATDQIASEHFAAWVRDQMLEASQADPSAQLPLKTKADARVIAGNMLKQLEWDTKRELRAAEIDRLLGSSHLGPGDVNAFFDGFRKACDNSRDWLADELLTIKGEMGVEERRRPKAVGSVRRRR